MGQIASRRNMGAAPSVLAIAIAALCSSCSTSASAACRSDSKPLKHLVLGASAVRGAQRTGPTTFDLNDGNDSALVALEDRLHWDPSQFIQTELTVGKGAGNGGKAITSVARDTDSARTARLLVHDGFDHLLPPFGSFRNTSILPIAVPKSLGRGAVAVHEGPHGGIDQAAAAVWVRGKRVLILVVDAPRVTNPDQLARNLAQRQDQLACA